MLKMKMMLKNAAMLALAAAIASACGSGGSGEPQETPEPAPAEQNGGEEPAGKETPAEETDGEGEGGAGQPEEEPEDNPDGEVSILPVPADLAVEIGDVKEIETQIEGMTEKVNVVEYVLQPYGIGFSLRDAMGEPSVEDGQAVFRTQMGDDVATVAVGVMEGVTVEEAAAEAEKQYAQGYEGGERQTLNPDLYPYPGIAQHYTKDGYYYGFDVVDLEGRVLVIHHSYPFDAGDGMGAVMHEMLSSIKMEG